MIILIISDGGLNINERNTLDAILLTKNISYIDGVKIDIYLTKDNYFVVANSNNLNDFTLSNKKINEVNYDYLRKVKFPSHIFKYYIPTLEEILTNYHTNKIVVLEIYDEKELDKLFALLIKYNYKYYFLSKDISILHKLKELLFDKIGIILNTDNIIYNQNNTFYIKN